MSTQEKIDQCIESYINGQIRQAKEQFKKLNKANRRELVRQCKEVADAEVFNFFFNLL